MVKPLTFHKFKQILKKNPKKELENQLNELLKRMNRQSSSVLASDPLFYGAPAEEE